VLAVNASLFPRARAERFAQLVDEANGGRRHHARSRGDEELTALVSTTMQLQAMPVSADPSPVFKRDLRAQLMAAAVRDGIGITAQPEARPGLRRKLVQATSNGRSRSRGAVVIGVAAGALVLSGVSVASGEAMPGDALYGMKRQTERAQLALAGSDLSRGQLYLDFARTRLQEAYSVRADGAGFVSSLRDMDTETQQGVSMLVTSALSTNDTTALDAIDRFVLSQRGIAGRMLDRSSDTSREKLTGSLALLSRVEQRALAARSALACGAKSTGNDGLGPIPGACAVTPGSAPAQQGVKSNTAPVTPEQGTAPAGEPGATPAATASPAASATPEENEEAESGGLLSDLGRILGGLLGG
jgi:hypothetical protein